MARQHVKPWGQTNKSDAADARAMQEPGMRFFGMASEAQQTVQALHRVRSRYLNNRTALVNQTRGILLEYGVAYSHGGRLGSENAGSSPDRGSMVGIGPAVPGRPTGLARGMGHQD